MALLCLLLAVIPACGGRRSQQQTELGQTFLSIGKSDEALLAFEKALKMNPHNTDAELGMARCFAVQDNLEEALTHYRRVIELDPGKETAYVEAVRILLRKDRRGDAENLAMDFEKVHPDKGGILHAFIMQTAGQTADAIALLEGLAAKYPASTDVRVSLASALAAAGQDAKAVETLEDVLANVDPDSLAARMKLVEVYQKQGKTDEIVTQFREMANQKPGDLGIQLALARSLVAKKEYAEAEDIARAILRELPESGWANYVVGACLLAREEYEKAVMYLQTATQALPESEAVRDLLAVARRGGAPLAQAPETAASTAPQSPAPGEAHPQSAGDLPWPVLWKQARFDLLLQQSDALLSHDEPNLRETLVLAALFSGDPSDPPRAKQFAEGLPQDSPYRALLAALEARDPEAALAVFDAWTETEPERVVLRGNAYGFTLMLVGARAKALQELSECYAAAPDNAVALFNLATMYRTARLPEYAVQVLDRFLALYPDNLGARRTLLRLLVDANEMSRARAIAEFTYQLYPHDAEAVVDLASVYRVTGEVDLAQSLLTHAQDADPDSAPLRVAEARLNLLQGRDDAVLQSLEGRAFDSVEHEAARESLRAFALAENNDWSEVTAICEALPSQKRSAGLHLLSAAAYLHGDKPELARGALDGASKASWERFSGAAVALAALGILDPPKGSETLVAQLTAAPEGLAAYVHGVACLAESLPDCAVGPLEKASAAAPGSASLAALMLEALTNTIRFGDPAPKAQEVAQRAPADPRTWLALAAFCHAKTDTAGEHAAIQKALELDGNNAAAWLLRARYLESAGDKAGALAAYERVHATRPTDPVVGNNLAYLILETGGDPQRALQLAHAALDAAQNNPAIQPNVLHTLGLAELRVKKLDDAEEHLGRALQMRPGDPTLLLDFGALLLEKGNTSAGQRYIRMAIDYADRLGLAFPRKDEAQRLIETESP
jgi:tetratricopeptide (TPR) repeat protein